MRRRAGLNFFCPVRVRKNADLGIFQLSKNKFNLQQLFFGRLR